MWKHVQHRALWIALCLQALLLFWRLDLLPRWDDELFTLRVVAQEPSGIIQATRQGVHPPLYFLLVHEWLKLPLPGTDLVRTRALSAFVTLLATLVFYFLWLNEVSFEQRASFLALWILSPCLELYARMARSYSLQLLLAVIALRLACDWLRSPGNNKTMCGYAAAAVALLYTHYLPGLVLVAGTAAAGLWRRQWRHVLVLGLIAAAYLPWCGTLARSMLEVSRTRPYLVSSNPVTEHFIRLGYGFVAFNFGETVPLWALAAGALLAPAIVWRLYVTCRRSEEAPVLLVLCGAIGYWIATTRVSFPFVGARMLFLLPFYYLFLLRGLKVREWRGALICAGLLVIAGVGLHAYFRRQDFLNKGYLVDFEQIAHEVEEGSRGDRALVLLDRYASSAGYYLHGPNFPYAVQILDDESTCQRALAVVSENRPDVVWFLRNSRDQTPNQTYRHIEEVLSRRYVIRRHYFVPYSGLDRLAMRWLRWTDRPTHVVEALEMRTTDPGSNPHSRLPEPAPPSAVRDTYAPERRLQLDPFTACTVIARFSKTPRLTEPLDGSTRISGRLSFSSTQ